MSSSVKITYLLSRKDKAQLFFYAYYSYPGWGWLRSLGGPALAVLGALIVTGSEGWFRIAGGFFVAYGIYYAIKPVIHFFVTRKLQIDTRETVTYDSEADTLSFASNQTSLQIPASDLVALKKTPFGKSIIIRVNGRLTRIFIPRPRVVQGKYESFIRAMESVATRNKSRKGAQ